MKKLVNTFAEKFKQDNQMCQKGLTVVTEINNGQVDELKKLLNFIGADVQNNGIIDFTALKTVHFMRWVIIDEADVRGIRTTAKLVLSTNYDGPLKNHLRDLTENAQAGLFKIYSFCKNAPSTPSGLTGYLFKHRKPIAAFYRGTAGRTISQIKREQNLWQSIQEYLKIPPSCSSVQELRNQIIRHLKSVNQFDWAFKKYKPEFTQSYGIHILCFIFIILFSGIILLAWINLPVVIILLSTFVILKTVWWLCLNYLEKKDAKTFKPAMQDPERVARLTRKEDYKVQNQLTHLVEVKPGIIRQYSLRFSLWAVNLLAKYRFNKGSLAGIHSIHYARWVFLDKGKRLLFFSNYDGSWESYLGEFVDRASSGLTGVWSHTVDFPPTKNMIKKGARNSAEFKAWAREKQIETQVWYSAYPTLSIKNINNNTEIRKGLIGSLSTSKTEKWLQRL